MIWNCSPKLPEIETDNDFLLSCRMIVKHVLQEAPFYRVSQYSHRDKGWCIALPENVVVIKWSEIIE